MLINYGVYRKYRIDKEREIRALGSKVWNSLGQKTWL